MSEEKVYPAIYKAVDGNAFVYLDEKNYYSIERECWDVSNGDDNHATDKNITREYLANTYGEVQSPEHAEFIVELCKVNNIELSTRCANRDAKSFLFYPGGSMVIYKIPINELIIANEIKQITIPLPPKQIQTATPEEEFEMTQIEKNNGDNLMFGGADKCEEWPCVGDDAIVTLPDGYRLHYGHGVIGNNAVVMALFKDGDIDIAAVNFDGSNYCFRVDMLQKPKTPEEELRDELIGAMDDSITAFTYAEYLAKYLLDQYTLTKKPQ